MQVHVVQRWRLFIPVSPFTFTVWCLVTGINIASGIKSCLCYRKLASLFQWGTTCPSTAASGILIWPTAVIIRACSRDLFFYFAVAMLLLKFFTVYRMWKFITVFVVTEIWWKHSLPSFDILNLFLWGVFLWCQMHSCPLLFMYIVFVSQTLQENLCWKYPLAFSVLNCMDLKSVCK
jgi:hypothetical protein